MATIADLEQKARQFVHRSGVARDRVENVTKRLEPAIAQFGGVLDGTQAVDAGGLRLFVEDGHVFADSGPVPEKVLAVSIDATLADDALALLPDLIDALDLAAQAALDAVSP